MEPINRRSLLQRGAVFLAGVLGVEMGEPGGTARAALAPESGSRTLRLYARRWQHYPHRHEPGGLGAGSGGQHRHGELFASPGGSVVGQYYSACFCPEGSFGIQPAPGAAIELHTFQLGNDTLFGMGSFTRAPAGAQMHAIVGGTGRFAGARGSYLINPVSAQSGGDVEIVLTVMN